MAGMTSMSHVRAWEGRRDGGAGVEVEISEICAGARAARVE